MSRLRRWWGTSGPGRHTDRPEDVAPDPGLASSRATGGEHRHLGGDRGSITGTGETGEFVGQVAGDDLGYAGETGAERRSVTEESEPRSPGPVAGADRESSRQGDAEGNGRPR